MFQLVIVVCYEILVLNAGIQTRLKERRADLGHPSDVNLIEPQTAVDQWVLS